MFRKRENTVSIFQEGRHMECKKDIFWQLVQPTEGWVASLEANFFEASEQTNDGWK